MDYHESFNFYKDTQYSVTRLDNGEWGGAIIFKDSITKQQYAFYQSTIYAFGKSHSGYLVFSHSTHGLYGSVTEISNPKKLYLLEKTGKLPNSKRWYEISDSISKHSKGIIQLNDLNDSVFDYVGVFSLKEKLYLIKSTKWFSQHPKYTVLCAIDIKQHTLEITDTLFNEQIYADQDRPWPNNAPVYNPFSNNIFIPIRSKNYRGFIQIIAGTLTLIKEPSSLKIPTTN